MYHGFWGRKLLLGVSIVGIFICGYYWYTNDRIMFAVSVSGYIFLWIGMWAGFIEGTHTGKFIERENEIERKNGSQR